MRPSVGTEGLSLLLFVDQPSKMLTRFTNIPFPNLIGVTQFNTISLAERSLVMLKITLNCVSPNIVQGSIISMSISSMGSSVNHRQVCFTEPGCCCPGYSQNICQRAPERVMLV
jgi:hypothetical protein